MAKSEQLKSLRFEIEKIDQQMLSLLEQRIMFVRQIADLKSQYQIQTVDTQRENELFELYKKWHPEMPTEYLQLMQKTLLEISYLEHRLKK